MPEYSANKAEDVQRMQAQLASIVQQMSDPRVSAAGDSAAQTRMNGLRRAYQEINTALGRDTSMANMARDIQAYQQGGDKFDPARQFALNTQQGPTDQAGAAPAASFGKPESQFGGGGQYGNGAPRNTSPYGYIINPNAYEYGGQAGLAEQEATRYGGLAAAAMQRSNEQYGQYGQGIGMSDQARGQQLQGLQMLHGMANGTGPSAAQQQTNMAMANARNQQASIAASARGGGGNLAAAQAASANAAGQMGMQGIQQGGLLRAQEQIGAMSQYGQQAGALRQSDFARAQLASQQQQMAAGQASQYEGFGQGIRAQQSGYQQAAEQQNLAREGAIRGWEMSQQQMNNQQQNQWISAGMQGAATLGMLALASDERAKESVSDASSDIDDALDKLKPVGFKYKKEFAGASGFGEEGDQTGIMAQALASSKAGSGTVFKGNDGLLRVKVPQATGLALAGLARLATRIKELEKKDAS